MTAFPDDFVRKKVLGSSTDAGQNRSKFVLILSSRHCILKPREAAMRMGGMIEELDSGICTSRQARHTVRENTLSGQTLRRSETPVPTPFSSTDSAAMMSFTHLSDRDRSQPLVCRRWGIAIYQDNMSRSRQAFPEGVIVRRWPVLACVESLYAKSTAARCWSQSS